MTEGSDRPRGFPIFTALAVVLYSIIPLVLLFLRPRWRETYERMDMLDRLPLPTAIMLLTPAAIVCLIVLAVNGVLIWAAWKGSPLGNPREPIDPDSA